MKMRAPWQTWLALGLIVLVGLALRLYRLQDESISLEEYACVSQLDQPNPVAFFIAQKATYPYGAPLAPLLFYGWTRMTGTSIVAVRLFCVLTGILILPLLYALGCALFEGARGRRAGLFAALCAALSHVHIFYAQEARMYGLLNLFALASVYCLVRALLDERKKWWVLHGAANMLLVWTHLFGVLLFAAEAGYLLLVPEGRWKRLLRWSVAHAVLLLPLAIYILTIPRQPDTLYNFYAPPTPVQIARDVIADDVVTGSSLGFPLSPHAWEGVAAPVRAQLLAAHRGLDACVAGLGVIALLGLIARLLRPGNTPRRDYALLLFWCVTPVLALALLSYVWKPCYSSRYTIHSTLALYLALGLIWADLPRAAWRGAMAVVCAGLYAYQLSLGLPGPVRPEWNRVIRTIQSGPRQAPVLIEDPFFIPVYQINAREPDRPVAGAYARATMAEVAKFALRQAPSTERRDTDIFWALLVDIHFQGGADFEDALRKRHLEFDVTVTEGEYPLRLYRVHAKVESSSAAAAPQMTVNPQVFLEAYRSQYGAPAALAIRKDVDFSPDWYAGPYIRLGLEMGRIGSFMTGVAFLVEAERRDPAFALKLMQWDFALRGKGPRAETEPQNPAAWQRLAIDAALHNEPQKALASARRVSDLDPANPFAWWLQWRLLHEAGDEAQAVDAIRKAYALRPDLPPAWHPLFPVVFGAENMDAARRDLPMYAKDGPPVPESILKRMDELAARLARR
jgi:tetratricopeptide (TPR) repeat protein